MTFELAAASSPSWRHSSAVAGSCAQERAGIILSLGTTGTDPRSDDMDKVGRALAIARAAVDRMKGGSE